MLFDEMCLMCHIGPMKTVSIRELHEATGRLVRRARAENLVITDRGEPVAILGRLRSGETGGRLLPDREKILSRIPRIRVDSTDFISEERDRS